MAAAGGTCKPVCGSVWLVGGAQWSDPADCLVYVVDLGVPALIDCGAGPGWPQIRRNIQAAGFDPASVHTLVLTHCHVDHIGAMAQLRQELKIPLAAHAADADVLLPPPEIMLEDGDTIDFGKIRMAVSHTPGHTPGGLCFFTEGHLLSGDTLFPGGPGRTNTPADFARIVKSITEKIFTLDDNTQVYPGHGEPTTIKKSKDEFDVFSSRPHPEDLCGEVLWLSS